MSVIAQQAYQRYFQPNEWLTSKSEEFDNDPGESSDWTCERVNSVTNVAIAHPRSPSPYVVLHKKLGKRQAATVSLLRGAIQQALGEIQKPLTLADRFSLLTKTWRDETEYLSSLDEIFAHPAYRAILELGGQAVPLILKELEVSGGLWFQALQELSGENPLAPEDAGRIRQMRDKWVAWGRQRGYI